MNKEKKSFNLSCVNINNKRGITLIALVITIIVLLILAGISIAMLSGENSILKNAQEAKKETIAASEDEKVKIAIAGAYDSNGNFDSVKLKNQLDAFGITNSEVSGDIIVKTSDGKQMIVSKETGTMNEITTDEDKVKLAVSNATDANGNFNSDKFKEELEKLGVTAGTNEIPVQTVGKDSIVATSDGKVTVKYEDGTTREVGKTSNTATLDAGWTKTDELNAKNIWYSYNGQIVNMPKLKGNMIGVKYTTTTGNKWANAVTSDGSMWVWIPRYAYRIVNGYHQSTAGTVEIIFLDTSNNPLNAADKGKTIVTDPSQVTYSGSTQNQFLVHPAFTNNVNYGGGFGEISGFWFAKYETSEASGKYKSVAGVTSLRNTSIGDFYKNARKQTYGEAAGSDGSFAQSHLIKNSEWGAVAFLTKSNAGTPNVAVAKNALEGYFTGGSNGNKTAVYTTNVTQSTTQNAYGVYDMNGGAWEYVASYVDNKHGNIATYGGDMATNRTSNKFYTVYKSTNTTGSTDVSYEASDYQLNKGMLGDAVYETSTTASGSTSWWSAHSEFPYREWPFFVRGGQCLNDDPGVFAVSWTAGGVSSNCTCRVALVP